MKYQQEAVHMLQYHEALKTSICTNSCSLNVQMHIANLFSQPWYFLNQENQRALHYMYKGFDIPNDYTCFNGLHVWQQERDGWSKLYVHPRNSPFHSDYLLNQKFSHIHIWFAFGFRSPSNYHKAKKDMRPCNISAF